MTLATLGTSPTPLAMGGADASFQVKTPSSATLRADASFFAALQESTSGAASVWRLSETSGTAAADSVGTTPGVYSGTYTLGAADGTGGPATCVTLAGGYVDLGSTYAFAARTPFSVELRLKPTTLATARNMTVIGRVQYDAVSPGDIDGWGLFVIKNTGQLVFDRDRANTYESVTSTANLSAGTWTHVVITYDGTTGTIYIDGAARGSGTLGQNLITTTTPLGIGSLGTSPYLQTLQGTICRVAIYTRALTAAEVLSHYQHSL